MKKTILGIILTIALIMAMIGTVNAASLSVSKDKVKAGETVDVKITAEKEFENIDFTMLYDTEKFEYVSVSKELGMVEANDTKEEGVVVSGAGNATKTISVKFKALSDVEAGEAIFEVKDTTGEALKESTIKVSVVKSSSKGDNVTDSEPKTGVSVFAGIVPAALLLAGAVLVIKKTK